MSSASDRPTYVGVDIGGTFTDLVFLRPDGRLDRRKVPTTATDYSHAIVSGTTAYLAEQGFSAAEVDEVIHATTVATNAILERQGVKTALITTEGFRDVLELRRIRIPDSYNLDWKKPVPLVDRALRYTVRERLDARGNLLTPLEPASLEPIVEKLKSENVEAVAICLIHSYRNPAHEILVGDYLRERLPDVHLSLSHEVLPEILEFERTSTTVVNAYVAPIIARYLAELRRNLSDQSLTAPILVMQSNGGLISANTASQRPVTIIESGPAAGVVAATTVAADAGYDNVITLDMGGTTTKASIIEDGKVLRGTEYEIGSEISVSSRMMRGGGYLLRMPVIDISEVGAGGGSIATLDGGGSLRVGPRSAGSDPGPVCYGNGNTNPTVTDANLVLGYLDPNSLAGGSLPIDRQLAADSIEKSIAEPSGMSLMDAAYGIHLVANSNMVRAIKSVSVERGRDPADFVLMGFGGAGPIHAAAIAQLLKIGKVVIPPSPGVFSAYGLIRADAEHHASRTVLVSTAEADPAVLADTLETIKEDVLQRAKNDGLAPEKVECIPFADVRYAGQSSELTIPLRSFSFECADLEEIEKNFEDEYERTYGYRGIKRSFEIVTLRLVARVNRTMEVNGIWQEPPGNISRTTRQCCFGRNEATLETAILMRKHLVDGSIEGPAIIQEYDTTVVIPPGCQAQLDEKQNVVIEIAERI